MRIKCGDANPNGNVWSLFKGGCGKELDIKEAYRCTGCGGHFHLECILKHFELEDDHNDSRNALRKIREYIVNELEIQNKVKDKAKRVVVFGSRKRLNDMIIDTAERNGKIEILEDIISIVDEGLKMKKPSKSFNFPLSKKI